MRAVVQRVSKARVCVEGCEVGSIGKGLVVLLGIKKGDQDADSAYIVKKILGLRVMEDTEGKMNLDLSAVGGELLVISQFTLYGDCRKGNRPGFELAAAGDEARIWYHKVVDDLRAQLGVVATGIFGADMKVELVNDGPVTILIDSDKLL